MNSRKVAVGSVQYQSWKEWENGQGWWLRENTNKVKKFQQIIEFVFIKLTRHWQWWPYFRGISPDTWTTPLSAYISFKVKIGLYDNDSRTHSSKDSWEGRLETARFSRYNSFTKNNNAFCRFFRERLDFLKLTIQKYNVLWH